MAGWQGDDPATTARYFLSAATGEEWRGSNELFGEGGQYTRVRADGVLEIWLSGDFTLPLFDTTDSAFEYKEVDYQDFR